MVQCLKIPLSFKLSTLPVWGSQMHPQNHFQPAFLSKASKLTKPKIIYNWFFKSLFLTLPYNQISEVFVTLPAIPSQMHPEP